MEDFGYNSAIPLIGLTPPLNRCISLLPGDFTGGPARALRGTATHREFRGRGWSVWQFKLEKERDPMKLFHSLLIIAALTLIPTSTVATAQSAALASTQASSASPALIAAVPRPAAFSSSADQSLPSDNRPAASAVGSSSAAMASEGSTRPFSSLGIGVKVGTGGIGFDVATPLVPGRLNLRGGAGFLSYTTTFTASNDNINGTLKLNGAEVMADLFPFKGSFRLSAGVTVHNNTAVNGTISIPSGGTLTNGDNKYYSDPAAPLGGTAAFTFGSMAVPRFTLGWGNMAPKHGHVRFETEIGIEYIGNPTVLWNVTGMGCTNTASVAGATTCAPSGASSTAWGPVAPADIAQQQANLQNDVNFLRFFPILNIGLSYKIH
jgi:hypothetical protein